MKSHFFWWSSSLLRSDIMSPLHLWITGTIIPHNTIQYYQYTIYSFIHHHSIKKCALFRSNSYSTFLCVYQNVIVGTKAGGYFTEWLFSVQRNPLGFG